MRNVATNRYDTANQLPDRQAKARKKAPDLLVLKQQARSRTAAPAVVKIVAGILVGSFAAALAFAWLGTTAAAPLAWAFGWIYLAWAVDAPRMPATITDGLLGLFALGAGLLVAGHPTGPVWLFAAHVAAWPMRVLVHGRDARSPPVAALWMSFHAAMALLLLLL